MGLKDMRISKVIPSSKAQIGNCKKINQSNNWLHISRKIKVQ
jgi:hypothetical protein